MNALKKYLGLVWLLLGIALFIGLPYQAIRQLTSPTVKAEDTVFWLVIVGIFLPITVGLLLFGWYAWKGEYEKE